MAKKSTAKDKGLETMTDEEAKDAVGGTMSESGRQAIQAGLVSGRIQREDFLEASRLGMLDRM